MPASYEPYENPDGALCELTLRDRATKWFYYEVAAATDGAKGERRWVAAGDVGSAFRRKFAELQARGEREGFEVRVYEPTGPLLDP